MLVKIKDNKIAKITIGDVIPDKEEILVPDDWDTKKIKSVFIKNKDTSIYSNKYKINESDPDKAFSLFKI